MPNEAAIGKSVEIVNNDTVINKPMGLQVIICQKKRAPFFALSYKTRANTQQVLPVQTGLYLSDEWMVRDLMIKTLTGVKRT